MSTEHIPWPDLAGRPHALTVQRDMVAPSEAIYRAWTAQFDRWFAAPGRVVLTAEVGAPYYFETVFNGRRYPHHGRFLLLEPDRRVVMTWVTGPTGTGGAETVLSVELEPLGAGTHVRLSHAGFLTEQAKTEHEQAWPLILRNLDSVLTDGGGAAP